jgi:segregation and condensation protein A
MMEDLEGKGSSDLRFSFDKPSKVSQDQIHGLLFSDKLSWQAIIYDLINTEQLNPWDIDISLLANKYLEKIRALEEANFFISSKVLLAASFLLRLKSEILLNHYLPSLDDILFGKEGENKKYVQERIELDEDLPGLIPRTPLPRFKKVTLNELMAALGKAINTENRRIRRVVISKQYELEAAAVMPKQRINLKDKIRDIYTKLREIFAKREERLAFSELAGSNNEERIATFVPLLHLDAQHKVFLEQEGHFEEIWIWLKKIYEKKYASQLEQMRKEVEDEMKKLSENMNDEEKKRAEIIEESFDNPIGTGIDNALED